IFEVDGVGGMAKGPDSRRVERDAPTIARWVAEHRSRGELHAAAHVLAEVIAIHELGGGGATAVALADDAEDGGPAGVHVGDRAPGAAAVQAGEAPQSRGHATDGDRSGPERELPRGLDV